MLVNQDIMKIYRSAEFVYYNNLCAIKRGGKLKQIKYAKNFPLAPELKIKTKDFEEKINFPNHERLVVMVKNMGEDYERKEIVEIDTTQFPKPSNIWKNHPLFTQIKLGKDFIKSLSLPKNYFVAVFIANNNKEVALISIGGILPPFNMGDFFYSTIFFFGLIIYFIYSNAHIIIYIWRKKMSSIAETKTEVKKEEGKREKRTPVLMRPIEYFLGSDILKQGLYYYVNVKVKGEKIEKTNSKLSPKQKENFDIALDSLEKRLGKITDFEIIFIASKKVFAKEKAIDSVSLSSFPSSVVDKLHPLYKVSENIKVFIRKDLVGLNDDYSIHLMFSKDGETILLMSM